MESRIPVVSNGVVSVNAAGSSPGKYSLSMNVFTVLLISFGFIKNFGLARLHGCRSKSLRFLETLAVGSKQEKVAAQGLRTACQLAACDRACWCARPTSRRSKCCGPPPNQRLETS